MDKDQEIQGQNQQIHLPFFLSALKNKPVEVSYTGREISSDGGALLLREVERQTGLIEKLSGCIDDQRDNRYVTHQVEQMLKQRIYQIACGYEDGNDCDLLRADSIFKICAGNMPDSEPDLASQPTISRFENAPSSRELYRMAKVFADQFMASYPKAPGLIILDCDDTNNNTYGAQQLSLFNNYYDEYCYMPLHIYEGLSGKLITTILKPGRRSKNTNVFAILKRIIAYLRGSWKDTIIVVRGDSHFCSPELMDWSVGQSHLHFATGLAGNSRLKELARLTIESAEKDFLIKKRKVKRYHSFSYQAASWQYPQRVIVKVEVSHKGTNVRYITTDMQQYRASHIYERAYCNRGAMELRIKDHKLYLKSDRSSCSGFQANQFRLFLHSAAYSLIHTLQKGALANSEFCNATMKTIQLKILKTAAWVKEMKTRIKIELPQCFAEIIKQQEAFAYYCLAP